MKIDTFILPFFNEKEEHFVSSIVVFIDVLRASSTICAALHNGAREVIPAESMEKALNLHANLSRDTSFLSGERNGIKPNGFDAGNSPLEFTSERIRNKSIVMTTTNGTAIINKIKNAKQRIIGSFVNLSQVINYIMERDEGDNIDIICAGNSGRFSFEDALCAGAIIDGTVENKYDELNDSSIACYNLYHLHRQNLSDFIITCDHARYLINLGFRADIEDSLTIDKYPALPIMTGSSFKLKLS